MKILNQKIWLINSKTYIKLKIKTLLNEVRYRWASTPFQTNGNGKEWLEMIKKLLIYKKLCALVELMISNQSIFCT